MLSTNHAACVMKNGGMNVPQDTPQFVCKKSKTKGWKVFLIKNISYNKSKFADFGLIK